MNQGNAAGPCLPDSKQRLGGRESQRTKDQPGDSKQPHSAKQREKNRYRVLTQLRTHKHRIQKVIQSTDDQGAHSKQDCHPDPMAGYRKPGSYGQPHDISPERRDHASHGGEQAEHDRSMHTQQPEDATGNNTLCDRDQQAAKDLVSRNAQHQAGAQRREAEWQAGVRQRSPGDFGKAPVNAGRDCPVNAGEELKLERVPVDRGVVVDKCHVASAEQCFAIGL